MAMHAELKSGDCAILVLVNLSLQIDAERYPEKMRWFLLGAWVLILAKCVAVWWAIDHWQVPIHAAWIIVPTLMMAALATAVWLVHTED